MLNAIRGEAWQVSGTCRTEDPEMFYAADDRRESKAVYEKASEICRRCPVRDACLEWALDHGEVDHGMWGGKTPTERRAFALVRRAESAA